MGKILYLECASGISGDMTVAALLDLGADREEMERVLRGLPVKGFEIEISRVAKSGLDVCDFAVKLDKEHENHDHDMEYLYGKDPQGDSHHEGDGHAHTHHHHHEHRGLEEITEIIRHADMRPGAEELALKIFHILGEAEAKAHGVPLNKVHFHEVGAVDSIVDIIAAAVCFDSLEITDVIIPEICEGRGMVRCQHGILPVPVPAVVNIVSACGLPVHMTETHGELITPTGAAIAAAIRTGGTLPERFAIEKVGLGAGKRKYDRPGILRGMLIRPLEKPIYAEIKKASAEKAEERKNVEEGKNAAGIRGSGMEGKAEDLSRSCGRETDTGDKIWRLETNIDDCSGEALGYVMELLLAAGARDVHYTPVFMKKNRPACQLNVICDKKDIPLLEEIIFRETTTIGIRRMELERHVLPRRILAVQTAHGEVKVKACTLPDGEMRYYPEYESAAELARKVGVSLIEVMEEIRAACRQIREA